VLLGGTERAVHGRLVDRPVGEERGGPGGGKRAECRWREAVGIRLRVEATLQRKDVSVQPAEEVQPEPEPGVRELRQVRVQVDHARQQDEGPQVDGLEPVVLAIGLAASPGRLRGPRASQSVASPTQSMRPRGSTTRCRRVVGQPPAASGDRTRARSTNGGRSGRCIGGRLPPGDRRFGGAAGAKMRGDMAPADERRYELLIRDGTVVDGTGAPGYPGAVGVTREHAGASARIVVLREPAAIEDAVGRTDRQVDARGKVVAPGSSTSTAIRG
jgi:hypothetical protein